MEQLHEPSDVACVYREGCLGRRALPHVRAERWRTQPLQLASHEEVHAVAHDRSAEREAELRPLIGRGAQERDVSRQLFVPPEVERAAMEVVRAALRDRVDQRPGKIPIPHVVRRQLDLVLLHRLDGDGLAAPHGARRIPAEERALVGAVQQQTVEDGVLPPGR